MEQLQPTAGPPAHWARGNEQRTMAKALFTVPKRAGMVLDELALPTPWANDAASPGS